LTDGVYLETDELIRDPNEEGVTFDQSTVALAHNYAVENGWHKVPGFEAAWKELLEIVGSRR
jgi:hypothetical protein